MARHQDADCDAHPRRAIDRQVPVRLPDIAECHAEAKSGAAGDCLCREEGVEGLLDEGASSTCASLLMVIGEINLPQVSMDPVLEPRLGLLLLRPRRSANTAQSVCAVSIARGNPAWTVV